MKLNLPILDHLEGCRSILIAGIGGGFDVYSGLPIYFNLQDAGFKVHLASYSFSQIENMNFSTKLSDTLLPVTADLLHNEVYFPEHHLASWFVNELNQQVTIYALHKTGVMPLLENYQLLQETLGFDALLMIDGGVDSLVRGDESETASLIEDSIGLYVGNAIAGVKTKILATNAFTIERDLNFSEILENVAGLMNDGAYLGCCGLVKEMEAYQLFESAVLYAQGQQFQDPSVINSSIISAVRGEFGDSHLTGKTSGSLLHINPLMSQYWFFELEAVASRHLFLSQLAVTRTFWDAMNVFMTVRPFLSKRPGSRLGII